MGDLSAKIAEVIPPKMAWSTTLNRSVRRAIGVVRAGKATIKHLNLVFIMGVILLYLMRFATTEPQRALYHE